MNELVTIDTIVDFLKKEVETKTPLPPTVWIDAAQKMNVLLGDEDDKLHDLQQRVAQRKLDYLEQDPKRNVSAAKVWIETTEEYRQLKNQESKIKRIEEQIRIAKIQARMRQAEFNGY